MRNNPDLWEKVKEDILEKHGGQWNGRLAQLSVKEYKRRGGTYSTPKDLNSSLNRWTQQRWAYALGDKEGRYLPQIVIDKAPLELLYKENQIKKAVGKGRYAPYTPELTKIMKDLKIF